MYKVFLVCYALNIQGILMQQCLCSKHAHGKMMYEQQSCTICSLVITQDCSLLWHFFE